MKLVFTAGEVAEALHLSVQDFTAKRSILERSGFPLPLPGLDDRWSVIEVVNWVNQGMRRQLVITEGQDRLLS